MNECFSFQSMLLLTVIRTYVCRGQRQLVQKVAALSLSMSGESPAKKANIMVKIGTHNGTFHCDEVLACFMLKQLPQYRDAEILR